MPCKLCQKDKKLIKSHIIPKFYYKGLRDEHGGIIKIDNSDEEQRIDFPKSGEYEKLLCFDCDNKKIGQLDDYASDLVGNESVLSYDDQEKQIVFPVIFRKYKLFLLSIFWRASVSTRFFWKNVDLAERINEELRLQILQRELEDENSFPCIGLSFYDDQIKNPFFVMSPLHYKEKETEYFTFIFGGYMWVFFLEESHYQKFSEYPRIKNNDKLLIPKMNLSEIPFLGNDVKESMRIGKVTNA